MYFFFRNCKALLLYFNILFYRRIKIKTLKQKGLIYKPA